MNQPITSVYKLVKLCGSHCGFHSPSKKLLAGVGAFKQWTHVSGAMGSDYSCDPETAPFSKDAVRGQARARASSQKESRVTSLCEDKYSIKAVDSSANTMSYCTLNAASFFPFLEKSATSF